MRRALLLATALAVPTLGSAQLTAGTMSFTNTDADPMAKTINIAECKSTSARVEISWQPSVPPTGAVATYQLYASNMDTANITIFNNLNSTTVTTTCPVPGEGASNGAHVVTVGNELTNPDLVNEPFSTSQMAQALVTGTVTDPCAGSGTSTIHLCMQGRSGGAVIGVARGTITLTRTVPESTPQLLLPISPGNNALTPRWADSANSATWYQVQAISVADPASVPTAGAFEGAGGNPADTALHSSGFASGKEVRLGGLQNGVTYAVLVRSFTADYNPSDPSNIGTGTPQVTFDFWDTYKAAGGQEAGGCSSGLAGPVGLLALAGALALARRRK